MGKVFLIERSISQINKRIDDGEANIYTVDEFKKLIKNDDRSEERR